MPQLLQWWRSEQPGVMLAAWEWLRSWPKCQRWILPSLQARSAHQPFCFCPQMPPKHPNLLGQPHLHPPGTSCVPGSWSLNVASIGWQLSLQPNWLSWRHELALLWHVCSTLMVSTKDPPAGECVVCVLRIITMQTSEPGVALRWHYACMFIIWRRAGAVDERIPMLRCLLHLQPQAARERGNWWNKKNWIGI